MSGSSVVRERHFLPPSSMSHILETLLSCCLLLSFSSQSPTLPFPIRRLLQRLDAFGCSFLNLFRLMVLVRKHCNASPAVEQIHMVDFVISNHKYCIELSYYHNRFIKVVPELIKKYFYFPDSRWLEIRRHGHWSHFPVGIYSCVHSGDSRTILATANGWRWSIGDIPL